MSILMTALLVLLSPGQDAHRAMHDRGALAMGFDQQKTVHHFLLYDDGGAIDISAKDPADAKDRDAIRSHLPHIAVMFGRGDFDVPMLVHDTNDIPGVSILSARADRVAYRYRETPNGGCLDMITTDPEALEALHAFLRYQIREHQTGDSGRVEHRK
jgi:hypothetical protein